MYYKDYGDLSLEGDELTQFIFRTEDEVEGLLLNNAFVKRREKQMQTIFISLAIWCVKLAIHEKAFIEIKKDTKDTANIVITSSEMFLSQKQLLILLKICLGASSVTISPCKEQTDKLVFTVGFDFATREDKLVVFPSDFC